MNRYYDHGNCIIWLSFLIAIVLQIMPWPMQLYLFCPSWINLLLIYWVVALPNRVNVGTGFILGLIMDLLFDSILGIHAFALSLLVYLVLFKFQLFHTNTALWKQAVGVILLSLITQLIIFCIELLIINTSLHPALFWRSMTDGILWPWLSLLMRKIRRQLVI